MVLAFPAEGYVYGMMYLFMAISGGIAYIFSAFFVVPVFHPLKLTSIYEYLNLRYGDNILRNVTMIIGVIYYLFYMGTVTYGTSVALEVVMGIPYWATIIGYITLTAIYTSIGGIRAVIWTDCFQFVIMVIGFVAIIVKGTIDAGGPGVVVSTDRFSFKEFSADPRIRYTFWNLSFGSIIFWLYYSYSQAAMQRVFSTPNVRAARNLYLICCPIYNIVLIMSVLEGGVIYAYYYSKGCDINGGGIVDNVNAIIPFTIMELFNNHPGLPGLFIAALSSAAFSTLSSCLSSLAAIAYEDVIKVRHPNLTPAFGTKISKIMTLVFGAVAMGIAFIISVLPGSIQAISQSIFACMDGPMCMIFILSPMFKRSTTKGLLTGAIVGMVVVMWLNMGKLFFSVEDDQSLPYGPTHNCDIYRDGNVTTTMAYKYLNISNSETTSLIINTTLTVDQSGPQMKTFFQHIYSISYVWFSMIGFILSMAVGIVASLLTAPPTNVNPMTLFSWDKHIKRELCGQGCDGDDKTPPTIVDEEMKFLHKNDGTKDVFSMNDDI
ncbi:sodium-coupled monocarboxylate transporter 2-like [Mya arenaria]|uniref:sodium-coupled monocarboxylate transporter 2-like n=1 Tax=Mya arenaria TaxID=6604 RepID=UPI0022E3B57A|nr:sodium-coupled monocarboxylate transporter 2-like [Mya arenaria]